MAPEMRLLTLCVIHKYDLSHSSLTGTNKLNLNMYLLYDGSTVHFSVVERWRYAVKRLAVAI